MVAYRVIDDHRELGNVGTLTHDQIDSYITRAPWLLASGTVENRPADSRIISAGPGIKLLDGGPGGSFTVSVDSGYVTAGNGIQVTTGSNGQLIISAAEQVGFLPAKWNETPFGAIDGVNNTYTLTYSPSPRNGLMLFYNGVLLEEGTYADFTLNENVITLNVPPLANTKLKAMYPVYDVLDVTWNDKPAGEVNGSNYTFLLNHTPVAPASLMLFLNGVLQDQGPTNDYVINGRAITFVYNPPPSGSKLKAIYQAQTGVNNALIDALASLAAGNSYRKGAIFGKDINDGIIDISSIGKFKATFDHQKDVDLYLNGMLLRGADTGADYFIIDQTRIFLEIPTKVDDVVTVIIRNSII